MAASDITPANANNQLSALSAEERERYKAFNSVIGEGLEQWLTVGQALYGVRDENLYREDFSTFQEYCEKRWGISRPRAYQLMAGAKVMQELESSREPEDLSTIVDTSEKRHKPKSESQARAVGKAPVGKRDEAWKAAQKASKSEQPTAAQITAVIRKEYESGQRVVYNGIERLVHSANGDGSVNLRHPMTGQLAERSVTVEPVPAAEPPAQSQPPASVPDQFAPSSDSELRSDDQPPISGSEALRRIAAAVTELDAILRLPLSNDARGRLINLRSKLAGGDELQV